MVIKIILYNFAHYINILTFTNIMDKTEASKPESPKTKSFKDLVVWQKSHSFTLAVFEQVKNLPLTHSTIVGDMLRESAAAISTNIVGGYRKKERDEKLIYLATAQDALEECRYYIILAADLLLLDPYSAEELQANLNEVSYLLNSYVKSIARRRDDDDMKGVDTSSFI